MLMEQIIGTDGVIKTKLDIAIQRLNPKFRGLYILAFDRMIEQRKVEGLPTTWQNGEEVMRWWLQEGQED